jgi:hypothetical protein
MKEINIFTLAHNSCSHLKNPRCKSYRKEIWGRSTYAPLSPVSLNQIFKCMMQLYYNIFEIVWNQK